MEIWRLEFKISIVDIGLNWGDNKAVIEICFNSFNPGKNFF